MYSQKKLYPYTPKFLSKLQFWKKNNTKNISGIQKKKTKNCLENFRDILRIS